MSGASQDWYSTSRSGRNLLSLLFLFQHSVRRRGEGICKRDRQRQRGERDRDREKGWMDRGSGWQTTGNSGSAGSKALRLLCCLFHLKICVSFSLYDTCFATVSEHIQLTKCSVGVRAHHSTATMLLSVMNGLLLPSDLGHSSVLVHLDLCAAFITDHSISLALHEHWLGGFKMIVGSE